MSEEEKKEIEQQQEIKNEKQEVQKILEKDKQEIQQQEIKKPKQTEYQQEIKQKFWNFVLISMCFAFFYVIGTYKIRTGIGVFIASLGQIGCCFAVLKQWKVEMKKDTVYYVVMIIIMNVLMLWTDQSFLHFWHKKMILLLFFMMMLHQFYEDKLWSLKTYIYNLFLLLFGSIASLFEPIENFIEQMKKKEQQNQKWSYILLGLGIALPLTFFIVAMLMSADGVFANMIIKLVGNLFLPQNVIAVTFLFVLGYWLFYCFVSGLARKEVSQKTKEMKQAEPIIAITFTSVLLVVYVLFCSIQIWYLFIGKGKLPEEFTYASYARRGFFELLFVSVINFLMVVICNWKFRKSKVLNGILVAVSACNFIMMASSFYRMMLYVKAYHMTVMRMYVLWFLAMLAVSMAGVVYTIFYKEKKLYQYLFVVVFVFLTALSAVRPQAYVTRYNLEHMKQYTRADIDHIIRFSSLDVVPELAKIDVNKIVVKEEEQSGEEIMKKYFQGVLKECEERKARKYHIGVAQAEKAAREYLEKHK